MALDARKRQRKLERKRAKQRARKKGEIRQNRYDEAHQLQHAGAYPVLHCCTSTEIWTEGMGNLLLSRMLPSRQVAFSMFLVDTYCLGVKDAFCAVVPYSEYEENTYSALAEKFELENLAPEAARKLVEGAVAYARSLGLPPHADYQKAKLIFGDIDAGLSTEKFEYGKDGKPYFIAGPHDSPQRCQKILGILCENCGEHGYHFTLPMRPGGSLSDSPLRAVEYDAAEDDDIDDDDANQGRLW